MFFGLWTGLPAKNVFLHKKLSCALLSAPIYWPPKFNVMSTGPNGPFCVLHSRPSPCQYKREAPKTLHRTFRFETSNYPHLLQLFWLVEILLCFATTSVYPCRVWILKKEKTNYLIEPQFWRIFLNFLNF